MMKPLRWMMMGILLLSAGAARSEEGASVFTGSLGLEEAQKEALDHSPAYQKAQALEREKGWAKLEYLTEGFLPRLSLSGQHYFNQELFNGDKDNYTSLQVQFSSSAPPIQFPGIYPETTLTLSGQLPLFDGFRNIHLLDAANNRHEATRVLSDQALLRLQEGVRLAFFKALAAKLLSDMADQNVKTFEDHLRIVKDQLDNGQATKYDRLRVEVQLSEAQSGQIEAHDNLVLARMDLARTMGLPKDERSLTGDLPALEGEGLLKGLPDHYEEGPELKAKRLQALGADDEGAAADGNWFPKVSLIGQYQFYNSPGYLVDSNGQNYFAFNNDFNRDYFIGAQATWDIPGGRALALVNEVKERTRQTQADYDAAKLQAPYEFDLWKRRLTSSIALYHAKATDVDKSKESARLATVGFKAGTRTTTDVLDAELEEYRASAGLVQAQLNALEALINLELVTGKRYSHD